VNDSPVGCQSRDLTEPQRDHDPPLQCKTIISQINRDLSIIFIGQQHESCLTLFRETAPFFVFIKELDSQ